jgi:hypothetical protein
MTCQRQRLVDRHFGRGLGRRGERALREHLPACAACRGRYERRLLLAELDPRRPAAQDRLGRALGIHRPASRARAWAPGLAIAAAAAIGLAWWAARPRPPQTSTYAARGAGDGASRVAIYRVRPGSPPAIVEDAIDAADELAFAYENPAGWRHLMIFGVDEHRHVYWYHPAWLDPSEDPAAISVEASPLRRELPEAIRHALDGDRLRVYAVFSAAPATVRQIEAAVMAAPPLAGSLPITGSAAQSSVLLEVRR